MSLFTAVVLDPDRCRKGQPCSQCTTVCPVSIFERQGGTVGVVEQNEDECMLCNLCLERCPTDALALHIRYSGEVRTATSLKR